MQPQINPINPVVLEAPVPQKKSSKKLLLIIVVFLLAGIFTVIFFLFKNNYLLTGKKPVEYWNNIIPGQTSRGDLTEFGSPKSETGKNENYKLLSYSSDNQIVDNYLTIDKKTAKVVSVFYVLPKNEHRSFDEFLNTYGQPEKVMYSDYSMNTKTAIYPENGLAVWFDDLSGRVIFIRYFESMDINDFIKNYGNGLFENDPYIM